MKNTEVAIKNSIKLINKTPYIFNTESDIKCLVYLELIKEYKKKYSTSIPVLGNEKPYKTNLVHTEYFGGDKSRIDVVVFDEKETKEINLPYLCIKVKNTESKLRYRPVKLKDAIEIKIIGGKGSESLRNSIEKDLNKLIKIENKPDKAHFMLIIRGLPKHKDKKSDFEGIIKYAKKECKKAKIQFYCNHFKALS